MSNPPLGEEKTMIVVEWIEEKEIVRKIHIKTELPIYFLGGMGGKLKIRKYKTQAVQSGVRNVRNKSFQVL